MRVFRLTYLYTLLQMIVSCHSIHGQTGNESISLLSLASTEIDGWKMIDQPRLFIGEQLFTFIDGGADIYMEFGFKKAMALKYSNDTQDIIQVEIYEMTDNSAAYGIFTSMSSPKGIKTDCGHEALLFDYYMIFWKGNYFVTVSGSNTNPEINDGIKKISTSIDSGISCISKKPNLLNLLSLDKISFTDVKYLRGNIALDNFYVFDVGDVLGVREAVAGKNDKYILMILKYSDSNESLYWLNNCKSKLNVNPLYTDFKIFECGFKIRNQYLEFLRFEAYKNYILIMICSDKNVLESTISMLKNHIVSTIR